MDSTEKLVEKLVEKRMHNTGESVPAAQANDRSITNIGALKAGHVLNTADCPVMAAAQEALVVRIPVNPAWWLTRNEAVASSGALATS